MKVITLWRPWGAAIIMGIKTIETRMHSRFASLVGETIGIHNGMKWHKDAFEIMQPFLPDRLPTSLFHKEYALNIPKAIIGEVEVVDHIALGYFDTHLAKAALCKIRSGMWGLVLKNPVLYSHPVEVPGAMGIWNHPR